MKRLVISTLSALAFSSLVAPAFASEIAAANRNTASNINEITPFNLVSASYQFSFRTSKCNILRLYFLPSCGIAKTKTS